MRSSYRSTEAFQLFRVYSADVVQRGQDVRAVAYLDFVCNSNLGMGTVEVVPRLDHMSGKGGGRPQLHGVGQAHAYPLTEMHEGIREGRPLQL